MDSLSHQSHFVLFPFMAQGHLIPMVDIARLLAQRKVIVTVVTTPHNAGRVRKTIARAVELGYPIRLVEQVFGLEDGVENVDMISSMEQVFKFFTAANGMDEAVEKLFEKLTPRPGCIISDWCLYYTLKIANKFQVPRITFNGTCCFCYLCVHNIKSSNILNSITSDCERFTVPGLTETIEFTKLQLPANHDESWKDVFDLIHEADQASYGVVINSFEELELPYVEEYTKITKVWCIGPVSLNHKDESDKAERGKKASINEQQCLKWLDSQENSSVIYACLGSVSSIKPQELIELGSGLEASNKPFIWVLRENNDTSNQVAKWIKEDGFEERTRGRGLVVMGWAPQVLILSHPAVGGFLTHCGWNSTIEGISAGVPLLTLPLWADQFTNEKLVVQVLKIGVSVGADTPTAWGVEKPGFRLRKDQVKNAIDELMNEGNDGIERRRAKEFAEKANEAVQVGGSSYLNMTRLIEDIIQKSSKIC
ncbi:UDP-glycosyltransferase 73C5-like [Hibiscus syriacus]|nr:UDP-glycosyltransferase 73C5-like [Hibiscus syriacus]